MNWSGGSGLGPRRGLAGTGAVLRVVEVGVVAAAGQVPGPESEEGPGEAEGADATGVVFLGVFVREDGGVQRRAEGLPAVAGVVAEAQLRAVEVEAEPDGGAGGDGPLSGLVDGGHAAVAAGPPQHGAAGVVGGQVQEVPVAGVVVGGDAGQVLEAGGGEVDGGLEGAVPGGRAARGQGGSGEALRGAAAAQPEAA